MHFYCIARALSFFLSLSRCLSLSRVLCWCVLPMCSGLYACLPAYLSVRLAVDGCVSTLMLKVLFSECLFEMHSHNWTLIRTAFLFIKTTLQTIILMFTSYPSFSFFLFWSVCLSLSRSHTQEHTHKHTHKHHKQAHIHKHPHRHTIRNRFLRLSFQAPIDVLPFSPNTHSLPSCRFPLWCAQRSNG